MLIFLLCLKSQFIVKNICFNNASILENVSNLHSGLNPLYISTMIRHGLRPCLIIDGFSSKKQSV
jgi:hypothetical protein